MRWLVWIQEGNNIPILHCQLFSAIARVPIKTRRYLSKNLQFHKQRKMSEKHRCKWHPESTIYSYFSYFLIKSMFLQKISKRLKNTFWYKMPSFIRDLSIFFFFLSFYFPLALSFHKKLVLRGSRLSKSFLKSQLGTITSPPSVWFYSPLLYSNSLHSQLLKSLHYNVLNMSLCISKHILHVNI